MFRYYSIAPGENYTEIIAASTALLSSRNPLKAGSNLADPYGCTALYGRCTELYVIVRTILDAPRDLYGFSAKQNSVLSVSY